MVDIWEKGQTFPLQMLTQFKDKLDASPSKPTAVLGYQGFLNSSDMEPEFSVFSTTPEGSPPQIETIMGGGSGGGGGGKQQQQQSNVSVAPTSDTNSILAALANMAKQNQNAPPPAAANLPPTMNTNTTTTQLTTSSYNSTPQNGAGINPSQQQMSVPLQSGVNVSAPTGNYTPQFQGQNNAVQNVPSNQANPFAGQPMPVPNLPQGGIDPAFQAQLAIVQMLANTGVPQDQWSTIIAAINASASAGAPGAFPQAPPPPPPQFGQSLNSNPALQNSQGWPVNQENSRDRNGNGYNDGMRSPPNRSRQRSRSRSPQRNGGWARDAPHNRRGDNNYGANRGDVYDRRGGRGGGNNDQYRQRSPPPRRRSPSPPRMPGKKWTDFDPSIPKDNIKGKQRKSENAMTCRKSLTNFMKCL